MSVFNPLDKILARDHARVEDLNEEELAMYKAANEALNKQPPTIPEQISLLDDLIEDLITKLCEVETSGKNAFLDANLKARIKMPACCARPCKPQKKHKSITKN